MRDGATTIDSAGWIGKTDAGASFTYSFGTPQAVDRIALMAVNNYRPAAWVVEVQAPGTGTWTQVASGTQNDFSLWTDNSSVWAEKRFTPTVVQAVRVRFTAAVTSNLVWLTEAEVYSVPVADTLQGFDAWATRPQATARFRPTAIRGGSRMPQAWCSTAPGITTPDLADLQAVIRWGWRTA